MKLYIVTVKLPRNPEHDPQAKVTGPCPATPIVACTDQTGEHHSYLVACADADIAAAHGRSRWGHVTRVEATGVPEGYRWHLADAAREVSGG